MPIYEYIPDGDTCEFCEGRFEVMQSMTDKPLTKCPECGQPCHRVFSTFGVANSTTDLLSPKNLESKGFTQYKKAGGGYYEKTAGKEGPDVIKR